MPGTIIIHVGCSDVTKQNMNTINPSKLVDNIINIGQRCASYGVTDIIMPSILPKRSIESTKIVREVNDKLKGKRQLKNFGFVCNDNVSINYLWKDGIHYDDKNTNILLKILLIF